VVFQVGWVSKGAALASSRQIEFCIRVFVFDFAACGAEGAAGVFCYKFKTV